MNPFSMMGAWSLGFRLLASRPLQYTILLIGLGVAAPIGWQYLAAALVTGQADPAAPAMGTAYLLAVAPGYALQTGAFFAALRLGLGAHVTFWRALAYGLLAGLVAIGAMALLLFVAGLTASLGALPGLLPFVVVGVALPVILAVATFATLLAALIGAAIALILVVAMVVGTATGEVGMAATMVGGSGFLVVILLILSVFLIWLAARLSCTTAVMADRRSFNPLAAIRASWDLTWDEQWRITGYLAAIGTGLAVLTVGALVAIGMSAAAWGEAILPALAQSGALVVGLVIAVPLTFLTVLVPAGIYLRLAGERAPVEVFA